MITEEQQAVIETSKRMQPQETLKIEACAGSGKTSALIEIAKSNPDKRFLYLAFNKAIVEEAKKRFPPNVRIFTTHGLAWKWYAYTYGTKDLVNIKGGYNVFDLKELFPDASYHELSSLISKFCNFCYSAETVSHDQGVRKIFEAVKSGKLSMTHDFYLKLYQIEYTNRFKNYEYVLLDEAQDTNPVTMALFTDNNCRRILVGDSHQSIYGFRGAFNALERAVADTTLHLSYSFRSVQSVLDRANYFLQRFSLYKENFVPMKSKVGLTGEIHSHCEIYRTNAGIITRISKLDEKDIRYFRLIRSASAIFGCALSLLAFKNKRFDKITHEFSWLKKFSSWAELSNYADDCDDAEISANLKLVDNFDNRLFDIYKKACQIADNLQATHVITTAHTAKGLEWDDVQIGDDFVDLAEVHDKIVLRKRKRKGKKSHSMTAQEFQQELNLYYVSVTRARYSLSDLTPNNEEFRKLTRFSEVKN